MSDQYDFIQRILWEDRHARSVVPIPTLPQREKITLRPEPYDPVEGHRKYDPPSIESLEDADCERLLVHDGALKSYYRPILITAGTVWKGLRGLDALATSADAINQRRAIWPMMDQLNPVLETLLGLERYVGNAPKRHGVLRSSVQEGRIAVKCALNDFNGRDTKLYRLLLAHAYQKH